MAAKVPLVATQRGSGPFWGMGTMMRPQGLARDCNSVIRSRPACWYIRRRIRAESPSVGSSQLMKQTMTEPAPSNSFQRVARLRLGTGNGEWIAIVCLAPLLLVIAFWNGFPIIYYDTGAYIFEGLGGDFIPERAAVYSLRIL